MFEKLLFMGYLLIFLGLIPIIYRALMALDFSQLFQRNSQWQIKFLMGILSIVLAFLAAFAVLTTMEYIRSLF
ncbi:MAG TPA: DUF1146 family protein [Bacilli bacterium]|nr:MAG: hypothetical protein BWY97_00241 [Tenericutes bacterium ADurb.BinA124]HNZ49948.1 DUF1146 family protein [Bacilli bacterium]HPN60868.1 DUF1146 family protein [Bacilli bacterium]HPX83717.1 DUF1146 family protein [Bacilli bacterium]HQC74484.1 DUF1146 family protein [Bacilli bacterium]